MIELHLQSPDDDQQRDRVMRRNNSWSAALATWTILSIAWIASGTFRSSITRVTGENAYQTTETSPQYRSISKGNNGPPPHTFLVIPKNHARLKPNVEETAGKDSKRQEKDKGSNKISTTATFQVESVETEEDKNILDEFSPENTISSSTRILQTSYGTESVSGTFQPRRQQTTQDSPGDTLSRDETGEGNTPRHEIFFSKTSTDLTSGFNVEGVERETKKRNSSLDVALALAENDASSSRFEVLEMRRGAIQNRLGESTLRKENPTARSVISLSKAPLGFTLGRVNTDEPPPPPTSRTPLNLIDAEHRGENKAARRINNFTIAKSSREPEEFNGKFARDKKFLEHHGTIDSSKILSSHTVSNVEIHSLRWKWNNIAKRDGVRKINRSTAGDRKTETSPRDRKCLYHGRGRLYNCKVVVSRDDKRESEKGQRKQVPEKYFEIKGRNKVDEKFSDHKNSGEQENGRYQNSKRATAITKPDVYRKSKRIEKELLKSKKDLRRSKRRTSKGTFKEDITKDITENNSTNASYGDNGFEQFHVKKSIVKDHGRSFARDKSSQVSTAQDFQWNHKETDEPTLESFSLPEVTTPIEVTSKTKEKPWYTDVKDERYRNVKGNVPRDIPSEERDNGAESRTSFAQFSPESTRIERKPRAYSSWDKVDGVFDTVANIDRPKGNKKTNRRQTEDKEKSGDNQTKENTRHDTAKFVNRNNVSDVESAESTQRPDKDKDTVNARMFDPISSIAKHSKYRYKRHLASHEVRFQDIADSVQDAEAHKSHSVRHPTTEAYRYAETHSKTVSRVRIDGLMHDVGSNVSFENVSIENHTTYSSLQRDKSSTSNEQEIKNNGYAMQLKSTSFTNRNTSLSTYDVKGPNETSVQKIESRSDEIDLNKEPSRVVDDVATTFENIRCCNLRLNDSTPSRSTFDSQAGIKKNEGTNDVDLTYAEDKLTAADSIWSEDKLNAGKMKEVKYSDDVLRDSGKDVNVIDYGKKIDLGEKVWDMEIEKMSGTTENGKSLADPARSENYLTTRHSVHSEYETTDPIVLIPRKSIVEDVARGEVDPSDAKHTLASYQHPETRLTFDKKARSPAWNSGEKMEFSPIDPELRPLYGIRHQIDKNVDRKTNMELENDKNLLKHPHVSKNGEYEKDIKVDKNFTNKLSNTDVHNFSTEKIAEVAVTENIFMSTNDGENLFQQQKIETLDTKESLTNIVSLSTETENSFISKQIDDTMDQSKIDATTKTFSKTELKVEGTKARNVNGKFISSNDNERYYPLEQEAITMGNSFARTDNIGKQVPPEQETATLETTDESVFNSTLNFLLKSKVRNTPEEKYDPKKDNEKAEKLSIQISSSGTNKDGPSINKYVNGGRSKHTIDIPETSNVQDLFNRVNNTLENNVTSTANFTNFSTEPPLPWWNYTKSYDVNVDSNTMNTNQRSSRDDNNIEEISVQDVRRNVEEKVNGTSIKAKVNNFLTNDSVIASGNKEENIMNRSRLEGLSREQQSHPALDDRSTDNETPDEIIRRTDARESMEKGRSREWLRSEMNKERTTITVPLIVSLTDEYLRSKGERRSRLSKRANVSTNPLDIVNIQRGKDIPKRNRLDANNPIKTIVIATTNQPTTRNPMSIHSNEKASIDNQESRKTGTRSSPIDFNSYPPSSPGTVFKSGRALGSIEVTAIDNLYVRPTLASIEIEPLTQNIEVSSIIYEQVRSISQEESLDAVTPIDSISTGKNRTLRFQNSTLFDPVKTSETSGRTNGDNSKETVDNDASFREQDNSSLDSAPLNPWPVKHSAVVEGDLVLGGLMMVHEREDTITCGPVMPQGGIQALEAMLYTLDRLNQRDIIPGVKIGAHILDDCDKDTYGLEMAVDFIKGSISNIDGAEYNCNKTAVRKVISGVVGAASSVTSIQVANLLRLFRIPQVSFFSTSPELSNKQRFEYFTRTIPSDHYQVKAMVDIVRAMGWSYVSIIYEESNYGIKAFEELEELLAKNDICIAIKEKLVKDSGVAEETAYDNIVLKLLTKPRARGCIIFGSDQEVAGVMRAVRRCNATGAFSWIGSDGWSARGLVSNGNEPEVEGTLSVQPQANPVEGFEEYFLNLTVENNRRNPWFVEFWEDHFQCRYPNSSRTPYNEKYTKMCTTEETLTRQNTAFEDQLQFVSDAVMAFAYAFRDMHKDLCGGKPGLCDAMKPTKGTELLKYLRKVDFEGLSGDRFRFDKNGDGPARYNIIHFKQTEPGKYKWIRVGKYLEGELRLNMSEVQFRLGHLQPPESVCSSPCDVGQAKTYVEGESCCWHCFNCTEYQIRHPDDETQCLTCRQGTVPDETRSNCRDIPEEFLQPGSGWAIGAMLFSGAGILVTLFVGGVFVKYNHTPIVRASGRELSYVLLTGILLCYLVTFTLVLKPTDIVCGIQRFSAGFCFTVVYAALLTKTNRIARIFKAGKHSAKRPSFISPRSQLIICSALVGVQILINGVWMVIDPARAMHHYPTREDNLLVCNSYIDASYMIAFAYPIMLIVVCTVYAVLTRKIPEAFNESKYIGFTMYTTCVIWLAFVPLYFGTGNQVALRITSMSVTISLSASVTIVCLFSPKLYIILIRPERNVRPRTVIPQQNRYSTTKSSAVTGTNASNMMAPVTLTAATCDQNKAIKKHISTSTDCSTQSEYYELQVKEQKNGKPPPTVVSRSTQTQANSNDSNVSNVNDSDVSTANSTKENVDVAKPLSNNARIGNGPVSQNDVPL